MLDEIQSTVASEAQPANAMTSGFLIHAATYEGSVRDSADPHRVPRGLILMLFSENTRADPLSLTEWRPFQRNTLRGFATVHYGALKIIDLSVHTLGEKKWCVLPAKAILDPDGTARRTCRGRVIYSNVLEWLEKAPEDLFCQQVIEQLEREIPDALRVR